MPEKPKSAVLPALSGRAPGVPPAGVYPDDKKAPHPPADLIVAPDGGAICPACGRVKRRSAAGDGVTKAEWPKPR